MDGLLSAANRLVAVDSEASYGDDAFGGSSPDEWIAFDEFTPTTTVELVEDEGVRATHSGRPHDVYEGASSVSWQVALSGIVDPDGTPSLPFGPLLKASNWSEQITADPVAYSYHLVTGCTQSKVPSCTIAYYMLEQCGTKARKMLFTGLRGNTTLTLSMGLPARLSGDFTGKFASFPSSNTNRPTAPSSYSGESNRFIVVGMSVEFGGQTFAVENIEIQTNWQVNEDRDATTASTTLSHVYLTRNPGDRVTGSMTLKGRSAALSTLLPAAENGSTFSFEAMLETPNGDRLTVEAPAVQFGSYSENRSGNINFDLPLYFNGTGAGENELTLTFDRT